MTKPRIEAIFPLTYMQQALLFHAIYENIDQGLLHVKCRLEGPLNQQLLQNAWNKAVQRHPAMRTSIHWEKIEKPVQVVHPESTLSIQTIDWSGENTINLKQKFNIFRKEEKEKGLELTTAPVSRITLIKGSDNEHWLLWSCHHILLDGWSAAIVFNDVFEFYNGEINGISVQLPALPSFKSYMNEIRQKDVEPSKAFWTKTLEGFASSTSFPNKVMNGNSDAFADLSLQISVKQSEDLKILCRQSRITPGTLFSGLWGMVLSRFFDTSEVVFGTTVSGRSEAFPNMELMAGLFMNVLPVRVKINGDESVQSWLTAIQQQQTNARNFEYTTLDQITSWIKWPGHVPLFESLLVFENFPWQDIESGGLVVRDFQGGITSTYPLTIIIKPGDRFEIDFRFNRNAVSDDIAGWLSSAFQQLLNEVTLEKEWQIRALSELVISPRASIKPLPDLSNGKIPDYQSITKGNSSIKYTPPQNAVELQLTRIWEKVFGRSPIGTNDNFFQIGGKSLLAVRLFAEIEAQTGRNIPPVTLLLHPTISALAKVMADETIDQEWSCIVPLRASGTKLPLFCLHAGGGHVLFYHAMTQHLDPERPVYAVQPSGLDGVTTKHSSIEEMAEHYLKEIRAVQPQGPYALLGTCFSNPICLEMAKLLKEAGQELSSLVIVDSPPQQPPPEPWTISRKIRFWAEKISKGEVKTAITSLLHRSKKIKEKVLDKEKNLQIENLRKTQEAFNDIYFKYEWRPFDVKITLIRSSEFHISKYSHLHIQEWKKIAKAGVEVVMVEGGHLTLFLEPDVRKLSRKLDECLNAVHFHPPR